MSPNEYQKLALRTESVSNGPLYFEQEDARLLQGLMGLNGEAGEAIDIFKKYLYQGHPLDRDHLARELGDVAWYLALSAHALGYSLEDVFEMNIEKLEKRYPRGYFESGKSVHRRDGDL